MKKLLKLIVFLIALAIVFTIYLKLGKSIKTPSIREENKIVAYISPISIDYLRSLNIQSDSVKIEEELSNGSNYKRYIASYLSEGNKVYGLLTLPLTEIPKGGFPAIVFNHGLMVHHICDNSM